MPRGRVRPIVRGGGRRLTSWFDIAPTRSTLTAAGGSIQNSLTAAELALRPFTIIRTHLIIHIESDQSAASEFQLGAVGMAVVTEQAVAAGVGSVPTPVTDDDSDEFFLHQWCMNSFVFADATGFDDQAGKVYEVDSKAMRKVSDSDNVIVVAEVDPVTGGGINMSIAGRLLIKNH